MSAHAVMLFVLTREGVYRHEILGVWDTLEQALAEARAIALLERDSYHTIQVGQLELNTRVEDVAIRGAARRGDPPTPSSLEDDGLLIDALKRQLPRS